MSSDGAEERLNELIDSFTKQSRDNERLQQEIAVMKVQLSDRSNRLVCLEEDSFSLRRTNADMAAMVEMRRTELETAKTQLLSEQSNNSKLRITLQSIEHTVAALSLKHREETAFLEGEVARVSEVLTAKVDTFREWLNSKQHLGILNSFYSHPIPGEDKAVTGSSVLSSQEELASAVSEGENQPHPSMLYDTPDAQRIG